MEGDDLVGRKEMLGRRMHEMKRFDSGEYFSSREKSAYLKQFRKKGNNNGVEEWRKKVFENQAKKNKKKERRSSLSKMVHVADEKDLEDFDLEDELVKIEDPKELGFNGEKNKSNEQIHKIAQSQAGKKALLERRIRHTRRFDSGDYFMGKQPEEQVVGNSPIKLQLDSKNNNPQDQLPQQNENQTPSRRNSAVMAQRFLQKKSTRKRWDSGDYNALLVSGSPSPTEGGGVPDLDIMSVSSAEHSDGGYCSHETKFEEFDWINDSQQQQQSRVHSPRGDNSSSKTSRSRGGSSLLSKPPYNVGLPPPKPAPITGEKNKLSMAQNVARKRLGRNQTRAKRFDSADYFRGLSPPSQEYEPILGESTLAQREFRAQKLKQQKQKSTL